MGITSELKIKVSIKMWECSTGICYVMNETLEHYAKWRKPDKKFHMCNSTHMKCPE